MCNLTNMKHTTVLLLAFFMVGFMIPSAFAENVPEWVKNTAGWWATGIIDDSAFLQGIQYLIEENIMLIPLIEKSAGGVSDQIVPVWVKNTAGWWQKENTLWIPVRRLRIIYY